LQAFVHFKAEARFVGVVSDVLDGVADSFTVAPEFCVFTLMPSYSAI
jgi:hypothetical protein